MRNKLLFYLNLEIYCIRYSKDKNLMYIGLER